MSEPRNLGAALKGLSEHGKAKAVVGLTAWAVASGAAAVGAALGLAHRAALLLLALALPVLLALGARVWAELEGRKSRASLRRGLWVEWEVLQRKIAKGRAARRDSAAPRPKSGWLVPRLAVAAGGALILVMGLVTSLPRDPFDPTVGAPVLIQKRPWGEIQTKSDSRKESPLPRGKPHSGSNRSGHGEHHPWIGDAPGSSLYAEFQSLERRQDDGMRAVVLFRNASPRPLSIVLDGEGVRLMGDQGDSYSVLGSDLPTTGTGFRLTLPAGESAIHQLDFPAPRIGSGRFFLHLATSEGARIRLEGSFQELSELPEKK